MPANPHPARPSWGVSRDERDADAEANGPPIRKPRRVPVLALDTAEACRAFGVSDNTLRRMIADGTVPALKIGTRTLIPLDAARQRLGELALAEARRLAGEGGAHE